VSTVSREQGVHRRHGFEIKHDLTCAFVEDCSLKEAARSLRPGRCRAARATWLERPVQTASGNRDAVVDDDGINDTGAH
jgi:hypothetical protein